MFNFADGNLEDGDVAAGDVVNGDAVDGFIQIAGCRGKKEQFKCFGQGSWVRLKYLKQRKKTSKQTERQVQKGL